MTLLPNNPNFYENQMSNKISIKLYETCMYQIKQKEGGILMLLDTRYLHFTLELLIKI